MSTATVIDERTSYRELFGVGEFRALFAAQVVSVLGNVVAQVALTVLVYARTRSAALSALTFTLGLVPYLLGGTLLAGVIDRLPVRRTLVACDLTSAVVVGLMTLRLPIAALLALIFAAGLVSPVFAGVRAAALPEILGSGQRFVLGRSMFSMVWQGAQVIGYALGGVLIAVIGARGALAIDAASFLGSACLVRLGLRARARHAARRAAAQREKTLRPRGSLDDVAEVMRHAPARRLMLLHWLLPSCALAPEALVAPYVRVIGGPSRDVGLLLSAVAAGMLVSNLLAGRLLSRSSQRRILLGAALLCVAPLVAFAAPLGFALSLAMMLATGVGYCYSLGRDGLFLEVLPLELRTRALVVDNSGLMAAQGIGFALWGVVAEILSVRTTIAVAGALGIVVVLALAPRWHSGSGRSG